jgi:hypothetical protein
VQSYEKKGNRQRNLAKNLMMTEKEKNISSAPRADTP